MSIYEWFAGKGPSGFGYGSTAEQVTEGLSFAGKTVLLTGCNSGLGHEALRVLTRRGARVLGTARTLEKAKAACASVSGETVPLACDLAQPSSVRACVEAVKQGGYALDAIIANAGIMALPKLELAYGYELQFFTNHIGHFILVTGLLESLTEAGRVVVVSSDAHRGAPSAGVELDNLNGARSYSAWKSYGQSKFANILFTKELARRLAGTGKTANALHPGVIATNLTRHMPRFASWAWNAVAPLAMKTVEQGAATEVYLATHPTPSGISGGYFADCNPKEPRPDANDADLAQRLWDASEKIVAGLP